MSSREYLSESAHDDFEYKNKGFSKQMSVFIDIVLEGRRGWLVRL